MCNAALAILINSAAHNIREAHMPQFHTVVEVADILRVSTKTVYRLLTEVEPGRRLEGRKIGHGWRIPQASLEAFIEQKQESFTMTGQKWTQ
jgi:excisionase family DNA binding protein